MLQTARQSVYVCGFSTLAQWPKWSLDGLMLR